MTDVDFLSSKNLRVLTEALIQAKNHGGKLGPIRKIKYCNGPETALRTKHRD
jgi:hypothetical protein